MMTYNRFQGDPAVRLKNGGASMQFIDGQPVMDQGLENAVQISLFTKKGWWGNFLFKNENQKIGSDYQEIRTIIDLQTINDYTDAGKKALEWMTKTKLAKQIDVVVTNPLGYQIQTKIYIAPPGHDVNELLFTKNGLHWLSQSSSPAHKRFTNDL